MFRQSANVRIGECSDCSFRVAAGGGTTDWAEASAVAFITAQMKFHYFSCPAHNRTLVPRRWHWVVKHRV